jgi:hypothetical protein
MSETQLMTAIRDACLATGRCRLFRNNSGKLPDRNGRWITYGLGLGSPDLVGFLVPSGRFLGLEVKVPGKKPTPEQVAWHRAASEAGALVAVVTSVAEALEVVRCGG